MNRKNEPAVVRIGLAATLLLAVLALVLSATAAGAVPIAIVNPGFEEPDQAPGAFTVVDPPGWTSSGSAPHGVWDISVNSGVFPNFAPEGNQVGFLHANSFVQVLGEVLAPNTSYTLQADFTHVPCCPSEFTLELLAGGVSLASAGGFPVVLGEFDTATVVFNTGPAHPLIGQALAIRISSTAAESEFDNVRLDVTCVLPPAGLVGWWPGDGDATDIQGGNDGTLLNGATFAPGFVTSGNGLAFSFDGVNDSLLATSDAFNIDEFTIDAWVKADSGGGAQGIADFNDASLNRRGIGLANGKPLIVYGDPSTVSFSTVNIVDGQFHHIAGTFDGTTPKLYVDGVEEALVNEGGAFPGRFENALIVGNFNVTSPPGQPDNFFFEGLVDELEIFNRALSGPSTDCASDSNNEICRIFLAGSAGKCKPTLDHFKCYKAKGAAVNVIVDLEDQFGVERWVLVEEPKLFCNPVDKNGEGILNPTAHLTCYKIDIETDGEERNVLTANQFGDQVLFVEEPELLCLPSQKLGVEDHDDEDSDSDSDSD